VQAAERDLFGRAQQRRAELVLERGDPDDLSGQQILALVL
jgi:hypothetical protein